MEKESLIYIDDLTGVGNRRLLRKIKRDTIQNFVREYGTYTIVITDIDHFKEINDAHGHLKGDSIIKGFSLFLRSSLRKNDVVIRYGGDEFVVIQPGLRKQDAVLIWQRLIKSLESYDLNGLKISMSVGLATYPDDSDSFDVLLKKADNGLYVAKRSGRGRVGLEQGKSLTIPPGAFIDRSRERDELIKSIKNNIVGLIRGEAGIGKTRLIREALSCIKGLEVLWADCIPFSRGISYYPIRELLRYRIDRVGKEFIKDLSLPYRVEMSKLVPDFLEDVSEHEIKSVGEVLDRYRLYEGFLLTLAYGERQKIIVIDNVQWLDEDSAEVLKYIVRRSESKINFVFASRTEEKNEQTDSLIAEISRVRGVKQIDLEPLSRDNVSLLIEAILGVKNDSLSSFVYEKSGGNVFYIEEIVKTLYENGALILTGDNWVFSVPEKYTFSRSIEDIVENKLKSLSPEGIEVLKLSSVLGYVNIDFIKDITGYNEGHIFGLLEKAVERGLLKETDTGDIRFKGEVVREIIYNKKVGNLKRKHLHKMAGEFLEKHHPDRTEELAHHFKMADVTDKIVEYAYRAALKSERIYANEKALKFYSWVVETYSSLEGLSKDQKLKLMEVHQKKAQVLNLVGRKKDAVQEAEKAINIAEELNSKEDIVRSLNILATLHWGLSENEKSIKEAERALEIAGELNDKRLIAESSKNLGDAYDNIGEFHRAIEYYNDALYIFRELKDRENQSAILNNIGIVYEHFGDYRKALDVYKEALKLSEEDKDLVGEGVTLVNIGTVHKHMGDYATALASYMKALDISLKIGLKVAEGRCYNNIGVIHGQTGNYEQALVYFKKELEISRNIGDRVGEDIALSNIGMLYEMIGEFKTAFNYHSEALHVSKEVNDKIGMEVSLRNLGAIEFKWGNIEESSKYLDKARVIAKEIGDRSTEALVINDIGTIEYARGNYQKAINLFKEALIVREEIGERPSEIESHIMLFECFLEVKEEREAMKHIDSAVLKSESLGTTPLLANVLLHKALWLIHSGKLQDAGELLRKIPDMGDILSNELWGDYHFVKGLLYFKKDEAKRAIESINMALKIYRKLNYRFKIAKALYYLALIDESQRKKLMEQSLRHFKEIGAEAWSRRCKSKM